MKRAFLAAATSLFLAGAASAASVTYEWTARVDVVSFSAAGVETGDTISGTVQLNTDTGSTSGRPAGRVYGYDRFSDMPTIEAFSISDVSFSFSERESLLRAYNDAFFSVQTGRYSYTTMFRDGWTVFLQETDTLNRVFLNILSDTGAERGVVTSTQLEDGIDFSKAGLISFGVNTRTDQFTGEMTSFRKVSEVPLPAGLPLLIIGLGGLAVMRRRAARG